MKKILSHLVLSLVVLSSFGQKTPITKEAGVIPPEFNQNNDTLLIISGNPFYNMSIKKHFKKNYTGNFIIVKKVEDYSIERCRYVLFEGMNNTSKTTFGGPSNGQTRNVITHDYFAIVDRKNNKKYINPNGAAAKLVNEYAAMLDAARQE